MLTPVMAYLKVSDKCDYSFLLESIAGGEKIGRYSFIGSGTSSIAPLSSYLLIADIFSDC